MAFRNVECKTHALDFHKLGVSIPLDRQSMGGEETAYCQLGRFVIGCNYRATAIRHVSIL